MASPRPMLRPGACVLRRDARHLQIGTSPGAVILDHPGLHQLLLAIDGVHGPEWLATQAPEVDDVPGTLSELMAAGVVLDAAVCDGRRPEESRHLAITGRDAAPVARRHRWHVALHGDAHTSGVLDTVGTILDEAGMGETGIDGFGHGDVDLLVVASTGEPAREPFAEAARRRIAHLVVRLDEAAVRIGPLVVPGVTPCVACEDLHRTDWDPAWAALVPQFGRRGARHNPPVLGAVLRHAAAVRIAAEIVDFADNGAPARPGWVTTVGSAHDHCSQQPAPFHHRCSCSLLPRA